MFPHHRSNLFHSEPQPKVRMLLPQPFIAMLLQVRDRDSSAWFEHSRDFRDRNLRMRTMVQDHISDYSVYGRVLEWHALYVSDSKFHISASHLRNRFFTHPSGEVESDNFGGNLRSHFCQKPCSSTHV